ncbi:hypothetical protein ABZZ17_07150 [Streptomyces sp. NPDC006512]|uniref:hypothetical protein n=1 Tax=Streptomyces sp. NPDC006512 TaxID=3154307 RepID=UPI0033AA932A
MGRRLIRIVIPGALLLFALWYGSYYTTILVWELRKLFSWIWLPVLLGLPWVIRPLVLRGRASAGGTAVHVLGGVSVVAGLVLGVCWLVYGAYLQDRAYMERTTTVTEPVPDLAARSPYVVGRAQAAPHLGDVTGEIADITYLPDSDRFATLVERRGWLAGYEVGLVQEVPLGSGGRSQQRCEFEVDTADARIGGWFGHNLGRKISDRQRWVRFDADDVYVTCRADGTPVVVVPLKRQTGILVVTERPAGTALYDGRTGRLTITTDTAAVPGASYPLSLAARQREATAAVGSFSDWWFERSGWDASEDGANEGNESDFTLRYRDGTGSAYVTPLTPQGEASSVVAVSTVPTRHQGSSLAPLTVHRLDPTWASPKAIVALIKAEYRDVCCYNDDRVFEVAPTGGSSWTATIGSEQNIRYRVEGRGQIGGREVTCLKAADGALIRCAYAAPGSPEEQELKRREEDKRKTETPAAPPGTGDLSAYTPEQLAELNRRLSEEINRRLKKT